MRRLFPCLLFLLLVPFALAARAEDSPPAVLLADTITYSEADHLLTARGNVQIIYDGFTLSAVSISYDATGQTITAEGPLILTDPDGTRVFADFAELSSDLRNGVMRGAQVLLASRFQLATSEADFRDDRYTILHQTVGSSCEVCTDRPVPIWQIRSARVIHDRLEKAIYFENATLDVLGLPVFYLPYLKAPDPTVSRASGFLVPEFVSSNLVGSGIKAPYYFVLDDHADATLAPFLTTGGWAIVEGQYRRNYARGSFVADGSLAFRYDGAQFSPRGFVSTLADFRLGHGFTLSLDAIAVSDDSFLREFDYSTVDWLTSTLAVSRYRSQDYFEASMIGFQSLRANENDAEIPFVFPEISYRHVFTEGLFGGRLDLGANMLGLSRELGLDMFRLNANGTWKKAWLFDNGLTAEAIAGASIGFYRTGDDPAFPSEQTLIYPAGTVGAEFRWPLVRAGRGATELIEPVIQVLDTRLAADIESVPNQDSQQVEFDETNLFAINRYPGLDRFETGLRVNAGVTYTRIDDDDWNLGLSVGQIFRLSEENQFSAGSGLAGSISDLVGAFSLEFPEAFVMNNRVLFDSSFDFKRAESQFDLQRDSYGLTASFLHLAEDATTGALTDRDEVSLAGHWRFLPNWEITGDTRYNVNESTPIEAEGGLTFGNECIRLDLSVSRNFTTSDNLRPVTVFGLSVALAGFGGSGTDDWPSGGCGV